ncbi:MAG: hypothetical protein QXD48_03575 [Candidatus Aenigmatarchaeota archaeon]
MNGFITNPFAALGIEFYGFLLPWIFTFAIVYGLLMKVKIFGETVNKQVSVALAFVLAFFVTAAGGPQLASFFITLFGGASAFLAGIIVLILFVSILGYGKTGEFKHWSVLAVVIIIGVLLFIVSSGTFGGYIAISGDLASLIFWLVIIIIAIYFVTSEKSEKQTKEGQSK